MLRSKLRASHKLSKHYQLRFTPASMCLNDILVGQCARLISSLHLVGPISRTLSQGINWEFENYIISCLCHYVNSEKLRTTYLASRSLDVTKQPLIKTTVLQETWLKHKVLSSNPSNTTTTRKKKK
jgi:hypothetical protein